jgi:hypothetical protein
MWGQMNGIVEAFRACSLVPSSQMLAQLSSFGLNLSIGISVFVVVRHASVLPRLA